MTLENILEQYVTELKQENDNNNENEVTSRREHYGKLHLQRILEENDQIGGVYTEITGSQGSGKTAVMLAFLLDFIKNYPNDKCFWGSTLNAPLQFLKLKDDMYHIMILEGSNIKILDREKNGKEIYFPNTGCRYPITYFKTFNELWDKAKPGCCNAVFFGDRTIWMDFIFYLRSKYEWAHLFIDEFGEVAPSDKKDIMWQKIRKFSEDIKEIRKCNKNIITNTQTTTDVDYRVRRKLMVRIFLPGAKADRKTRVYQRAIDNLTKDLINGNMAYLDYDGKFGVVRFKNIFKPIKGRNWEARIIKPGEEDYGSKTISPGAYDSSGYTQGTRNTTTSN